MTSSLPARFDGLRRRLRRGGIVQGLAIVVVAGVVGVLTAGVIDAVVRSNSTAFRLLLTLLAAAPAGYAIATVLIPPFRLRISDTELARRIEQRDPFWSGRLASAAAFQSIEPAVGSPFLQRQLITDVNGRLAWHPLPDLIDRRRLRAVCMTAGGAVIVALMLALAAPSSTATALSRLALPLASIEWPRNVDLVLLTENGDPLPETIQIGRGQTLRFIVRNVHGDVPQDLSLLIVPPDGRSRTEPMPMIEQATAAGIVHTVGSGTLLAEAGPLRFRAVGGDHRDMPFVRAEVVPPPVFERIEVTVIPPLYLGREPVASPEGIGSVQGFVGSSVTVQARSNKPLKSAELRVGDRPGPEVSISEDGRRVSTAFTLSEPGFSSYWFRLVDRGGFENPQPPRYEIRTTADGVPEVKIIEPLDDITATPFADLPVVTVASDDFGLIAVRLRFNRGGFTSEGSADVAGEGHSLALFHGADRPVEGTFPLIWSLEPLKLNPGERLVFYGEATDAYDLGEPHVGTSGQRTVTIVSAVEKRNEILDRQSELLDELVQIRRDETRLRNTVESLRDRGTSEGEVPAETSDLLARTELEQRQLSAKLIGAEQGVRVRAARALADLATNRLEDADMARRFERITQELGVLADDALPAADRNLTAARKAAGRGDNGPLASAATNLTTILGSIDALLNDLGAWRDRRDIESELGDLLSMQQELNRETARVASETLGTAAGQLSEEQLMALRRASQRQHGLADRLARFENSVSEIAADDRLREQTTSGDLTPPPAKPMGDTGPSADLVLDAMAEQLRQAGLPALARSAGESLRNNDLGEAGRQQQQLEERLRGLRESLSPSAVSRSESEGLQAAAERLEQLATGQREILETLRKARDEPDGLSNEHTEELARRQAEIREATASVARNLRDAGGREAAQAADAAGKQMGDGLERLLRSEETAAQQSLERALEQLEKSRKSAVGDAERIGRQLAQERLESAREAIAALAERQGGINRELARLETVRAEQGRHSRSQLLTLRRTAETQADVAAAADALVPDVESAAAVVFTLRSAIERMRLLEKALRDKNTGEAAQQHGAVARRHLERIAANLQSTPEDSSRPQESPSELQEASSAPGQEMIPLIAQLKLARDMQNDLRELTQFLNDQPDDVKRTEAHRVETERLARQQSDLADLVREVVQQTADPEGGTSE